ncbi:hypothetical protein VQ574_21595 (plasmid) [Stutzerimonas frequens]|uniref:hypothetical protein n=1 Tax=Stutzerimonas frequens TaxID=2968969 RepID=UPI002DB85B77|nr:hypothetical protein [Stutzerimonas frequens]WRW29322.1 hypothetical protein VQ574_21595 [Stutzerimonas frequens]
MTLFNYTSVPLRPLRRAYKETSKMFTIKNTAAMSFAVMVFTGLFALITKGLLGYTLAVFSAIQAYFFVHCTLGHLDCARDVQNRKAATSIDAAD